MATPLKTNVVSIVPSKDLCVSCSVSSNQRYYIVKKSGEKGPGYALASEIYSTSFYCCENYGSYVCKTCYRLLDRIIETKKTQDRLSVRIYQNSQSLRIRKTEKRVINRTPNSKQKICLYSSGTLLTPQSISPQRSSRIPRLNSASPSGKVSLINRTPNCNQNDICFGDTSPSVTLRTSHLSQSYPFQCETLPKSPQCPSKIPRLKSVTPKSKIALFSEKCSSIHICSTSDEWKQSGGKNEDKFTQTDIQAPRLNPHLDGRRQSLVTYRSLNLKNSLSPVLSKLCNGSVQSAVELLLQDKTSHIRNQALAGITRVVHRECSKLCKKSDSLLKTRPADLSSFQFNNLQDEFEREIPTTWNLLCSVATNKQKKCDKIKATVACCTLFHSRQISLNALQHCVSVCLYNNQLQKEGFMILSRLGVTTSHVTLNNSLNKMKGDVDKKMLDLRLGVENGSRKINYNENITDHEYARSSGSAIEMDHDYMKQISLSNDSERHHGYRFNIDNLDFLLQVRNMTQDHQNQSKHYVQLMAIKDRVYCEDLIDDRPMGNLLNVPNADFLPNGEDISSLRDDIITVVSHILIESIPAFSIFKGVITHGFEHEYSKEMKEKSVVVVVIIIIVFCIDHVDCLFNCYSIAPVYIHFCNKI